MAKFLNSCQLFYQYIIISIKSQMQYRASFIMFTISHFGTTVIEILGIWALFARFGNIKGWSLSEVALFYGIINIAFASAESFARGFDLFSNLVKSGDFDLLLLRPRSTILQVAASECQLFRLGRLGQGLIVLTWSFIHLGLYDSWLNILLTIFAIIGGTCMFYGLFILQATLAFWSTETLELMNILTYGGTETGQYPLPIFKRWFQYFFIFIVPLGCVIYFPAIAILKKADTIFGTPIWLQSVLPVMGIFFLILAVFTWRVGVRHYRSTGS